MAVAAPPGLPAGALGATDLETAYDLPASGGSKMTIGIVDAQDLATAETDLAKYRSYYGLPPCTTDNGCLTKVNQEGHPAPLPTPDPFGWGVEIALDIDMASAACPTCKILLVEANSQAAADLGAAVKTAVAMGADVVSNSYGWSELDPGVASESAFYDHPGVLILAAAGDQGYDQSSDGMGVSFPAASPYVLAVGGTSLARDAKSARGWTETAWDMGGSGCSTVFAKPSWQSTATQCKKRMVADISAVADIEIALYEDGAWQEVGGTSVASPLVAGIFARTGNATVLPSFAWEHPADFFDVTSGNNGTCTPDIFCTAGKGYDGPTGWGTPNGAALRTTLRDGGADAADAGPKELVKNGGFETGRLTDWTLVSGEVEITSAEPHSGKYSALIGSTDGYDGVSMIVQSVAIPPNGTTKLSFWGNYTCPDKAPTEFEHVSVIGSTGTVLARILSTCTTSGRWEETTWNLSGFAGQTVTLRFDGSDDHKALAYWHLDDVSVTNVP
jgi:hypothetical protein